MEKPEQLMAIYDAALSENRWTAALDALQYETQTAGLMFYSNSERQPITYHSNGVSSSYAWISDHLPDYNKMITDPRTGTGLDAEGSAFMHGRQAFKPVRDDEIWAINDDFLSRSEIQFTRNRLKLYRRFFLNLSSDPLTHSALLAHYPVDAHHLPFEADMQKVASLAPHFGKALEMSRTVSSLRAKYNAVLAALDQINAAMCIVEEKGHVVLRNRRANELFGLRDGIWITKNGGLACRNSDDLERLRDATERISKTAAGQNTDTSIQVKIHRLGELTPLFAIVSPLRDADMELDPGLTGALVTILDGTESCSVDLGLISEAYGLSEGETRVLALIVQGYSNPEVAESLSVSPETIKSHVSSILSKTNSKSRLLLLWRVFQWAPPLL